MSRYHSYNDSWMIEEPHFDVVAEAGKKVAVIVASNLTKGKIVSVEAIFKLGGEYTSESATPPHQPHEESFSYHYSMLDVSSDVERGIGQHVRTKYRTEENGRGNQQFQFDVVWTSFERSQETTLAKYDGKPTSPPKTIGDVVSVDDDESVALIEANGANRDQIKMANEQYGAVRFEKVGEYTLLVGATDEKLKALSEQIFDLQQDHKEMGFYDSAEAADHAETMVISESPQPFGDVKDTVV